MDDKNNINKKEDNDDENSYIGYGVGFGLMAGSLVSTIIGMFFNFPLIWAFGPGFGMFIGIIIASIIDFNKKKDK